MCVQRPGLPKPVLQPARSHWPGRGLLLIIAVCVALTYTALLNAADHGRLVEVRNGTASFETATNMPAIRVHGTSNQLRAQARLRENGDGITLEDLEATLPVASISTGLGLRDTHMRKYIFTTAEGDLPDLRFVARHADCSSNGRANLTCAVAGELAIRGRSRPLTIALKVRNDGSAFRAVGDAVAKLSAYEISPPSQLGVRTEDDVRLHLEFTARLAQPEASPAGGTQ